MTERAGPTEAQVAALDGAVAELLDQGIIAGWVAIQTEHFRNLFLSKQLGCWLLFTWADGSIEIEEDYPPYALVPELLAGTFTDEDRSANYQVVWVADDRGRRGPDPRPTRPGSHPDRGHPPPRRLEPARAFPALP